MTKSNPKAKPKAKPKAQVEAEKAHAEAKEQLDNDELARRHVEAQQAAAKAAREQEEAAKKAKAPDPEEELMNTPLNDKERAEMEELEERANRGTFQPFPTEMIRLGKLRQRAKL